MSAGMNDPSGLGPDLGAWLEAGPSRLPATTRQAILAGIRVTGQASTPTLTIRIPRERASRARWAALVAVAFVGLALLGAILLTVGRPTTRELPADAPAPSAGPMRAAHFRVPFDYKLPAGVALRRVQQTEWLYRWDTFQERTNGAGPRATIVVKAFGQRFVDPCDEGQGVSLIDRGPTGAVAYLQSIPSLTTTGVATTSVDGLPASQAVIQRAPLADCPALWPFPELVDDLYGLPTDTSIRFTITQVGNQLVAIGLLSSATDMDTFTPMADAFMSSLRFDLNHPTRPHPTRTYVPGLSVDSIGPGRLQIATADPAKADGDQLLSEQDAATQRMIALTDGAPPGTAVNMAAAVDRWAVLIGEPDAGKIIELDRATGQEVGHVILSRRVITSVAWARPRDEGAFGDEVWIGQPDVIERAGLKDDGAGFVIQRIRLWAGATVTAMAETEPVEVFATDLWALAAYPCTLIHVDPQIGQVVERLPLGGAPCPQGRLAVSREGIWVRTDRDVVLVTQDGP